VELIHHVSTAICKHHSSIYSNGAMSKQFADWMQSSIPAAHSLCLPNQQVSDDFMQTQKAMSLATASTHFLQPVFHLSNSVFVIMWQVRESFIVRLLKHQHCGRPDHEPLLPNAILQTIDTPQGKMNGQPRYKWTVAFYTVGIIAHQFCRA
jgi:hypothetical protein